MKRSLLLLTVTLFGIGGCTAASRSKFSTMFALQETVSKLSVRGLTCSNYASSASTKREVRILNCQIMLEREEPFDEEDFFTKLKTEVEQQIIQSGAKLTGSGSSYRHFDFDYQDGTVAGSIDVDWIRDESRERGQGNNYKLRSIVRERH